MEHEILKLQLPRNHKPGLDRANKNPTVAAENIFNQDLKRNSKAG